MLFYFIKKLDPVMFKVMISIHCWIFLPSTSEQNFFNLVLSFAANRSCTQNMHKTYQLTSFVSLKICKQYQLLISAKFQFFKFCTWKYKQTICKILFRIYHIILLLVMTTKFQFSSFVSGNPLLLTVCVPVCIILTVYF